MKKYLSLILLLLTFVLVLGSCSAPDAPINDDAEITDDTEVTDTPDAQIVTDKPLTSKNDTNDVIHATVKRFVSASSSSAIDPNTFEIVNIAELHSIKGGEFYGYLVDVKDAENSTAHMVIEAADNKIMMYSGGRSIFIKKVELGEVDLGAKLYYSTLELWVEKGDTYVNLIGGDIVSKDVFLKP